MCFANETKNFHGSWKFRKFREVYFVTLGIETVEDSLDIKLLNLENITWDQTVKENLKKYL